MSFHERGPLEWFWDEYIDGHPDGVMSIDYGFLYSTIAGVLVLALLAAVLLRKPSSQQTN